METSLSHVLVRLGADELQRIPASRGQYLVVFHGKVWLTQPGDRRDHVVSTGETFTFDREGLALVEALEPTTYAVLTDPTPATEVVGYEAAWPQIEVGSYDRAEIEERARALRRESFTRVAGKVWSGLTGATPERQAA